MRLPAGSCTQATDARIEAVPFNLQGNLQALSPPPARRCSSLAAAGAAEGSLPLEEDHQPILAENDLQAPAELAERTSTMKGTSTVQLTVTRTTCRR